MEDRLEIWLELLAGKLDRLIELGENVERASRSQEMPEEWGEHEGDHFVGAGKMVANEPPKKWRILHPGESIRASDWENEDLNSETDPPDGPGWRPASMWKNGRSVLKNDKCIYARLVADEPAKEPEPEHPAGPMPDPGDGCCEPTEKGIGGDIEVIATASWIHGGRSPAEPPAKEPKPAWEPKVGDWVRVTRPVDWIEWEHPKWEGAMNQFDEKIGKIECEWGDCFQICGFAAPNGFRYQFHRDWLSPVEPPAKEKPAEPEYRQPVLPADARKECQFSDDGSGWHSGWLDGWVRRSHQWISHSGGHWRHCRIKKES